MNFNTIMDAIANNGLAVVLVVVFIIYGRKFVNKIIDHYAEELNKKDTTINNHLDHVDKSLNKMCIQCAVNKETLDGGFDRVVDAINTQTSFLKGEKKEE